VRTSDRTRLIIPLLASIALCPIVGAQGAALAERIPALASAQFGWLADTEFLPPAFGPGPVTFDRAHPYVRNNTAGQPTFRIGDLTNPILQPWVVERMRRDNAEVLAGKIAFTARSTCWPAGVPGFLVFGCGARTVYFLQTPKQVIMINEGDQQVRHIYLNVPHSSRPRPSWYGESVGHYEGDTLVVDTIGQNTKGIIDPYRTPHTEKLHVVERWRRIDNGNGLEVEVTIDDPDTFNQPWKGVRRYRQAQQQVNEQVCAEGNFLLFDYGIPVAKTPDF
jgi:hypothetical protein